jgi:type I restriction enzyme S subunit
MNTLYTNIPPGWEEQTIKELGNGLSSTVQTGPFGAQLHAKDYLEDGVPLLLIRNLIDGRLNVAGMPKVSEKDAARLSRYSLAPGDVVFSRVGRVGSCFLAEEDHLGWLISGQLLRIRIGNTSIDRGYLYRALTSRYAQDQIGGESVGTTRTSINTKILESLHLLVPTSTSEQSKIAEVFSTVDRAIEQTKALIAKQQRIKTGLMQDLLTRGIDEHGNLRSEQTHAFKDSPLGRIPVEWEVTPANQLCDAVIDCKNRTPPIADEGHPVIRTPNVRGGEFVFAGLAYTDPLSYDIWVARGKPRAGDVVITREAPFGEVCQIPEDLFAPCLGQRMMMYQTNPAKLRPDYLVYAICSEAVQTRLLELAGGSTVGHIRVGDIRKLSIPHPIDLQEQIAIATTLSAISTTLRKLEAQQHKLCALKTALMQDLLTGNKRVTPLLEMELTH